MDRQKDDGPQVEPMKPASPMLIAAGVTGAVAIMAAVLIAAPTRTAEATIAPAAFVRPDFAPPVVVDRGLQLDAFAALGRKGDLRRLARSPEACLRALEIADAPFTAIEAIRTDKGCGVEDAVRVDASYVSHRDREQLDMTCALAARLYVWERHVVAPAAEKHFGARLERIEALGAFSCRTIAGYDRMSEHAFGKAADIAAFRLDDGRRISVLKHWRSKGAEGRFLREIHDRACGLFDVTLGPDYNEAHANHFHLDVGGNRACR